MDGKNDTENSRSDQFLCVAVGVLGTKDGKRRPTFKGSGKGIEGGSCCSPLCHDREEG